MSTLKFVGVALDDVVIRANEVQIVVHLIVARLGRKSQNTFRERRVDCVPVETIASVISGSCSLSSVSSYRSQCAQVGLVFLQTSAKNRFTNQEMK